VAPLLKGGRDALRALATVLLEALFLAKGLRRLHGLDALLICGSGQLNDYVGGPWGYPWTLYKWTLLARLADVPVMFLSVGAGPISTRLGRALIVRALRRAVYRSYRDPGAERLIAQLGITGDPVVPDMAYALQVPEPAAPPPRAAGTGLRVGCCPLPYCDGAYWHVDDQPVYRRYVAAHADAAAWLVQRGHVVEFYATQLAVDPGVIDDIRRVLEERGGLDQDRMVFHKVTSLEDLAAVIAPLDLVVPTRYHGAVLAYRFGKPVLGILYHEKARELLVRMGQIEHGIEIDALSLPVFQERFEALARDREAVSRRVTATWQQIVKQIEAQFDLVLAILAGRGAGA
jgi:polysaccharide pyruvyl transferase WcaK-like protein